MKKKNVEIKVTNEVENFIKQCPELENNLLMGSDKKLYVYFSVEEFLKRDIAENDIWVSYERKMCCGVGKCGHCKMDDTYICIDGPVFDYSYAKNLID